MVCLGACENKYFSLHLIFGFSKLHTEPSCIGSGDRSWRRQHGIGAKYSRQCSLQGVGITRDSFLPSECRINEQMAMRDTPRSTKLSNETKAWAKKHNFFKNEHFMEKLRFVQKRVKSVDTLPNLTKEQKEELVRLKPALKSIPTDTTI